MKNLYTILKKRFFISIIIFSVLLLSACSSEHNDISNKASEPTLRIVSGSENKSLQPLIDAWAKSNQVNIDISYQGSVDIHRLLQQGDNSQFDAVWPANHLWITLSDEHHLVQHEKSIMRSPIVLGLKKSIAQQLGWINSPVKIQDILEATTQGKFRLSMTSATQSNSGASAYLGFLYAMSGYPDTLTQAHLDDPNLQSKVKQLLNSVNRSSGSSGWLKEAIISSPERFDAMFNYEAMLIEANQQLVKNKQEPLCIIYPQDGLSVADSPLAYIGKSGETAKEALFLKLQKYLLSKDIQAKIENMGRRTGLLGMDVQNVDKSIWNPDWCVDTKRTIAPIPTPEKSVIQAALNLYQTDLRKPSLTVWVLDISGSMSGTGIQDLKTAMTTLLDTKKAQAHLLQAGKNDITYIIPFNHEVQTVWEVRGNTLQEQTQALRQIQALDATGGTDLYRALSVALDTLKKHSDDNTLWNYLPAIVAMSDGRSQTANLPLFEQRLNRYTFARDVPIHAIVFGDADKQQLESLTQQSLGRLFDSQGDLGKTLREAKGYN
jgi:Ca-activated chloride channel family protein